MTISPAIGQSRIHVRIKTSMFIILGFEAVKSLDAAASFRLPSSFPVSCGSFSGITHLSRVQLPHNLFQLPNALLQLYGLLCGVFAAGSQIPVVPPPIQPYLFGFIDRADQESNLHGQEFNVRERNLDVAGYHKALIKDPVQDVNQSRRPRGDQAS
jgi:hypothetical protein